MKNKTTSYLVIAITFLAVCLFGTVFVHAFWYNRVEGEAPLNQIASLSSAQRNDLQKIEQKQQAAPLENPFRLVIPTLGIDAKIQKVGITKKGRMATPTNFTDVGWYKYGPAPGEKGSVVMAGHVDNGLSLPGVFKHLEDLQKGDDLYVQMGNGDKIQYVVTGLDVYDYDADGSAVFNQKDGHYLKLVTCTGTWMPQFRTHDKRLVVVAKEV